MKEMTFPRSRQTVSRPLRRPWPPFAHPMRQNDAQAAFRGNSARPSQTVWTRLAGFWQILVTWCWRGCERSDGGQLPRERLKAKTGPKAATYLAGYDKISAAALAEELLHVPH